MKKKLTLLACFLTALLCARADGVYAVTGPDLVGCEGSVVMLPVKLYNTMPLRDFNFHLALPEGITVQKDDNGFDIIEVNKTLVPYHTGVMNFHEGVYKIVVSSTTDAPVTSDDQVLFTLPLVLGAEPGSYEYEITFANASQDIDGVVSNIFMGNYVGTIDIEPAAQIADPQAYTTYTTFEVGTTTATFEVNLNNSEAVKAFNFDIVFPEGIEPIYDEETDDYLEYSDRIPSRFNVYGELNGNTLNVDGATTKSTSVAAGDGAIVSINIDINLPVGKYPIRYTNQSITLASGDEVSPADFTGYIVVVPQPIKTNIYTYHDELFSEEDPVNYVAKDTEGGWYANSIILKDASPVEFAEAFEAGEVSYTRTFAYDVWQALFVPYNMDSEEWLSIGSVAEFSGVHLDGETAVLEWRTVRSGELKANHPYIIKPNEVGSVVFTGHDRTFQPTASRETVEYTDAYNWTYTLAGVLEYKYDMYSTGAYGLAPDGNFMHASTNGVMLKPMRIFMQVAANGQSPVKAFRIDVDGTQDGINDIEVVINKDGKCYDLQGREITNPRAGLFISNGQKIYIK